MGQVDGSGWEGGWTVWMDGWKDGGRKKGTDRRMDLCVVRKIKWDGIGTVCMVNRDDRREWGKIKGGVEKRGWNESEWVGKGIDQQICLIL